MVAEQPSGSTAGGTVTFAKDHVYADEGAYTVTVTVKDQDGGTGMQIFNLTLDDVPPTIDTIADQTSVKEGNNVTVPNVPFPISTENKHVATIDWGDNSTPDDGTVTEHTGPSGTTVPNDGTIKFPITSTPTKAPTRSP